MRIQRNSSKELKKDIAKLAGIALTLSAPISLSANDGDPLPAKSSSNSLAQGGEEELRQERKEVVNKETATSIPTDLHWDSLWFSGKLPDPQILRQIQDTDGSLIYRCLQYTAKKTLACESSKKVETFLVLEAGTTRGEAAIFSGQLAAALGRTVNQIELGSKYQLGSTDQSQEQDIMILKIVALQRELASMLEDPSRPNIELHASGKGAFVAIGALLRLQNSPTYKNMTNQDWLSLLEDRVKLTVYGERFGAYPVPNVNELEFSSEQEMESTEPKTEIQDELTDSTNRQLYKARRTVIPGGSKQFSAYLREIPGFTTMQIIAKHNTPKGVAQSILGEVRSGKISPLVFESIITSIDIRKLIDFTPQKAYQIQALSSALLDGLKAEPFSNYTPPADCLDILSLNLRFKPEHIQALDDYHRERSRMVRDQNYALNFRERPLSQSNLSSDRSQLDSIAAQIVVSAISEGGATQRALVASWAQKEFLKDERLDQDLGQRRAYAAVTTQNGIDQSRTTQSNALSRARFQGKQHESKVEATSNIDEDRRRMNGEHFAERHDADSNIEEMNRNLAKDEARREQLRRELDQRWKETEEKIMKAVMMAYGG